MRPAEEAGQLIIRPMQADDSIEAELDLRHRSFGPMDASDLAYWETEVRACIDESRQFGVWRGGDLIGAARFYDMRQWWHGRAQPMAGVAGVKVAPEARGTGVGRALMRELLAAIAGRGYALSVLYPSTAPLYRSLGWELAGGHYRLRVPGRSLSPLLPPDPAVPASDPADSPGSADPAGSAGPAGWPGPAAIPRAGAAARPDLRRAGAADAEELIRVLSAVHAAARDCGPCTWDTASARRWLAMPDLFAYLASDGFIGYYWRGGGHDDLEVSYLQAASAATARALWGIVASHAAQADVVHAVVGPADPVSWLTREPDIALRRHKHWMLRVVDAKSAIAGRGFPASVRANVPLLLADAELPANSGPHTLSVRAGEGALTRGLTATAVGSPGGPPVRFGARGFAALFGGVPMATLRAAGLTAGGNPATDEALDAAFGCQPFLLDYF